MSISEAKKITDRLEGIDRCASCDAEIIWAKSVTGKSMPVDPEPIEGGNIVLVRNDSDEPPTARYEGPARQAYLKKLAERRRDVSKLFVSHFTSCPDAEKWRKG